MRDFRVDPAPAPNCVGKLKLTGKEAVERGVPGIEGGSGNVAAVAAGIGTVGADPDEDNDEADC